MDRVTPVMNQYSPPLVPGDGGRHTFLSPEEWRVLRWLAAAAIFAIPVPLEVDTFIGHPKADPLVVFFHAIVFGAIAACTAKWGISGFCASVVCASNHWSSRLRGVWAVLQLGVALVRARTIMTRRRADLCESHPPCLLSYGDSVRFQDGILPR